jgi:hypothetical protein
MGRELGDRVVVPILVPSGGRADVAYLNFGTECALGKEEAHTPVVIFVRAEEYETYRVRWPGAILATLPD